MKCHVNLSVEKGTTISQKEMKEFAPKSLTLKFGYSCYVGHYAVYIAGPKKALKEFLENYIPWGATFIERGAGRAA